LNRIDSAAFRDCSSLRSICLPCSIHRLPFRCFRDCPVHSWQIFRLELMDVVLNRTSLFLIAFIFLFLLDFLIKRSRLPITHPHLYNRTYQLLSIIMIAIEFWGIITIVRS
jgi:hypothetical protein